MTRLLEKAINKIRTLPEAEQDTVAALILGEFSDEQQHKNTAFRRSGENPARIAKEAPEHAERENAEQISGYIKALVEAGRVPEARRVLSGIRPGISKKLDYWKKAMAEPVARLAGPGSGGDMRKDMLWFEKNADRHRGKWVALKEGILLGSHEQRAELRRILEESGNLAGTTFFKL
jgi:hypothetical protein